MNCLADDNTVTVEAMRRHYCLLLMKLDDKLVDGDKLVLGLLADLSMVRGVTHLMLVIVDDEY